MKVQLRSFSHWLNKAWKRNETKIKYHIRSIVDSFVTGVLLYLMANWGTFTASVSNLEWAAFAGLLVAGLRSGWKMASRPLFNAIRSLYKALKRK